MILKYEGAALPRDQEKGLKIAAITSRLWNDDFFYRTVVAYAESARSNLYGPEVNPNGT